MGSKSPRIWENTPCTDRKTNSAGTKADRRVPTPPEYVAAVRCYHDGKRDRVPGSATPTTSADARAMVLDELGNVRSVMIALAQPPGALRSEIRGNCSPENQRPRCAGRRRRWSSGRNGGRPADLADHRGVPPQGMRRRPPGLFNCRRRRKSRPACLRWPRRADPGPGIPQAAATAVFTGRAFSCSITPLRTVWRFRSASSSPARPGSGRAARGCRRRWPAPSSIRPCSAAVSETMGIETQVFALGHDGHAVVARLPETRMASPPGPAS